ncbi:MBL fold metallo-hydrolase [Bacillus solitudinis]|uniref:MBL fold metallo-hydrolase n=1 Tax=Bacillus solitudinis TaxID=2014074 RepID=UPI000C24B373|nr:MBL fold metallo-hydrolase [Bacillus solitudinis]
MKIIKEDSIYQLAFMPKVFPVNCYLVEEQNELTLVDAALPYCTTAILRAAGSLKKSITRIVLTHGHADHVGALDGLKKALPEAKVYISKRDAKLLKGDISLEANEKKKIRGGIAKNIVTNPDYFIKDGDQIGSLLAISTPGHTPGSMSFHDIRHSIVIVGDAFQSKGGFAVSGTMQPFFPFPALATWNKQDALRSAKMIEQLNPKVIACGHGRMVKEPKGILEVAIKKGYKSLKGES